MRSILLLPLLMVAAVPADAPKPRDGSLKVGDVAPAFELKQLGTDKSIKLADLKDKPIVLVFGSCT